MKLNTTTLAVLSALAASHVFAAEQPDQPHNNTAWQPIVQNLEAVVVRGTPFAQKMGTQRITNRQIMTRPAANGTITDLLHDNPNVQFSNMSGNSNSAGEIAPENVSFHGQKFYENNWMIDGMSNNDNVNPGSGSGYLTGNPDGNSATDLPAGGTQSFWVNSDIIQRADVYDSNISAKYGQFTGGVVDAKLKDPDLRKATGSISFRTGRDNWTKYHVEEGDDFYNAETYYNQPKFTKRIYSINVNQPINNKTGLLFSYNRTESDIPYHHAYMDVWTDQKRKSETYVLKGSHRSDNGGLWKLTAMYSPHKSTYWARNVKNGAFSNNGGGYRINLEQKHLFDRGHVETYLGYKRTQNKMEHSANSIKNWTLNSRVRSLPNDTSYLNWKSSNVTAIEGGHGEFETANATWTAKQDYVFDDLQWGGSKHNLSFGWQADFAQAHYKRHADVYAYSSQQRVTSATGDCVPGDDACLSGDTFFTRRTVYPARDVTVGNNHYAAYFQDKINWGKWELTPGLRIDHDRFLGNTDFSPRFTASYDMFGNGNTRLFGGVNRYYANSMLAYKLQQNIGVNSTETRTRADQGFTFNRDNTVSRSRTFFSNGNLKTPHSDEVNLGWLQRIGDNELTLKWVKRNSKNGLAWEYVTEDGVEGKRLNNNGVSSANTLTLNYSLLRPIKWEYATLGISGGMSYSRNKSNTLSYETQAGDDQENERIILDGKLTTRGGMKAMDYNNPWRAFANLDVNFPKINLNWSNRLNYTAGYSNYSTRSCSSAIAECMGYGSDVTLYTKTKYKNLFTVDWRFVYSIPVYKKQKLDVTLDVLNVFDTVAKVQGNTNNTTSYKLGRQYWLGARYTW